MKLISLNTWGGRTGKEKLLAFFAKNKDVDVFCLQEIWSAPYEHLEGHSAGGLSIDHSNIMVYGMQEISTLLESHTAYFKPHHLDNYGLMMLIKKDLDVISEGDVFVYKDRGYIPKGDVGFHARNVQFVTIATKNGNCSILNFHSPLDHIHLVIVIPPRVSVADIVQFIKSQTGKLLKAKFPFLKKTFYGREGIWSRGYCVSTVGLNDNEKEILAYVTHQEKEDKGQLKLEL